MCYQCGCLKASITKTKHMRMNSRTNEPIKLQGENIEEVAEFTYLGSKMTADGSSEREIRARQFTQKHLEILDHLSENKNTPFQDQCPYYPLLWIRILENYKDSTTGLKSFRTDAFAKYSRYSSHLQCRAPQKSINPPITLEIK